MRCNIFMRMGRLFLCWFEKNEWGSRGVRGACILKSYNFPLLWNLPFLTHEAHWDFLCSQVFLRLSFLHPYSWLQKSQVSHLFLNFFLEISTLARNSPFSLNSFFLSLLSSHSRLTELKEGKSLGRLFILKICFGGKQYVVKQFISIYSRVGIF